MSANPIDLIGGLASAGNVVKADLTAWAKARVPQLLADATELRNTTLSPQLAIFLKSIGALYVQDTTDTTTADDGINCIISSDGKRFKLQFVTNAEMATMAAKTIKGNPTNALASAADITISALTDISTPHATLDWFLIENHTTGTLQKVNATELVAAIGAIVTTIGGASGAITLGAGLVRNGQTISAFPYNGNL